MALEHVAYSPGAFSSQPWSMLLIARGPWCMARGAWLVARGTIARGCCALQLDTMHYGGRFGSHARAWMRVGLCLCTGGAHVAASLAQVVTYAAKSVRFAMQRQARAAKARRFRPSTCRRARATAPMAARLHFSPEAPVGNHGPGRAAHRGVASVLGVVHVQWCVA